MEADLIANYEHSIHSPPDNHLEQVMLDEVVDILSLPPSSINIDRDIFEAVFSSITMINCSVVSSRSWNSSMTFPL